jgi:hypothetical protein
MKAENRGNEGFLQRESVEHQGYEEARSTDRREGKERGGASGLLEAILDRDNLNRAYKRVKSNHGAAGIDGMSVEEALPWLKEHREELLQSIRDGSYEPSPVRRKEIPKPDGGVRKLGIPTVVDRVIQQGIAQKLQNIWEPQFSDSSYGYRPKRSGQQAIQKVKEYAERNRGRNVRRVMAEVKVFIRGWLGYFHVAEMKRMMKSWDEWLRRRFRMYIWKQWKKPRTKVANLKKLGIPADKAYQWGNSRLGYWRIAGSPVLACSITNERLAAAGYFSILNCYESLHSCD